MKRGSMGEWKRREVGRGGGGGVGVGMGVCGSRGLCCCIFYFMVTTCALANAPSPREHNVHARAKRAPNAYRLLAVLASPADLHLVDVFFGTSLERW